jgi:hypothetical protein
MVLSISPDGDDFFIGWNGETSRVIRITPNDVFPPGSMAVGREGQVAVSVAASPDVALPVWHDDLLSTLFSPPVKFARIDREGNTPDTTTPTMDVDVARAVWNGQTFAVFGYRYSHDGSRSDLLGASIDASGHVRSSTIRKDMRLVNAWWDGSAYRLTTVTGYYDYHILQIGPDMTILSDLPLYSLFRYFVDEAVGAPGRSMILTRIYDTYGATVIDDRGSVIGKENTFTVENGSGVITASNGRDEFLVAVTHDGVTRASRITAEGRMLDDLTDPVLVGERGLLLPPPTVAASFGDRWIIVSPAGAIEFPSRKRIDLTGVGTVMAMAPASSDRTVILSNDLVTSNGHMVKVLVLRDLIDDPPPRRRAAH